MMKQMQKMQEKMEVVQAELEKKIVVGESGGGMVKVKANGKQRLLEFEIEPDLLKPEEREMLEDLLVAAANQALENAARLAQEEIGKITGGMLGEMGAGGLGDFLPKL